MKLYTPRFKERNINEKAMKATCNRLVENLSLNECIILLRKRKAPQALQDNTNFSKVQKLLESSGSTNPEAVVLRRILRKAIIKKAQTFRRYRVLNALQKIYSTLVHIPADIFVIDESLAQHGKLLDIVNRRKKLTNAGGVCHGVSSVAVVSILNNKLDEFDKTLDGIAKGNAVDQDFLHAIEFLQQPAQYAEILREQGSQFQSVVHNYMLLPHKLVNDPIALVAAIAGNYNLKSLTKYFEQMRYALFANKDSGPIALQLNNLDHSIAVTYDFENKSWRLINASKSVLVSEDDIAKEILKAFNTKESQNLIISTKIIANEANVKELQYQALEVQLWNLQNMNTNIQAAARNVDHLGNQLFAAAAKCGDLLAVKKLLVAHQLNPNIYAKNCNGLSKAAQAGNLEMMDFIINHGADVNLDSPLFHALYYNQTDAVKRLLEHPEIDIKKPVKMTRSYVHTLAKERKIPKADLDAFMKTHFTRKLTASVPLLDFAKLLGQHENVALIEQKAKAKATHSAKMFSAHLKKDPAENRAFKAKTKQKS